MSHRARMRPPPRSPLTRLRHPLPASQGEGTATRGETQPPCADAFPSPCVSGEKVPGGRMRGRARCLTRRRHVRFSVRPSPAPVSSTGQASAPSPRFAGRGNSCSRQDSAAMHRRFSFSLSKQGEGTTDSSRTSSPPRRRGPSDVASIRSRRWVPACAGMTAKAVRTSLCPVCDAGTSRMSEAWRQATPACRARQRQAPIRLSAGMPRLRCRLRIISRVSPRLRFSTS